VTERRRLGRTVLLGGLGLILAGCAPTPPPAPGPGAALSWSDLPGWQQGTQAGAWRALLRSCEHLAGEEPWASICEEAELYPNPTDAQVRAFFRHRFRPRPVYSRHAEPTGLITGYYEPLLRGSLEPSPAYPHPVYGPPGDLVHIDLGPRFPDLQEERVRGRLTQDGRVVPYYTRAEIEGPDNPLAGEELLWVRSIIDRFFLHIQGSGRVRLPSGETVALDYADQNGRRYVSIGRVLAERGEMDREEVTLPRLRQWLRAHPDQKRELLNENPSYVFFRLRDRKPPLPVGTLGSPLTPWRSIAVDPDFVPLGSPVWLSTRLPETADGEERRFRRLVFAQDTGGAIQGPARADVFFGQGRTAERLAGRMKEQGRLYLLTPAWQFDE